jgi:hypothetical protein
VRTRATRQGKPDPNPRPELRRTDVSDTLKLTDEDIETIRHTADSPTLQGDADGTDADGTDADGDDGDAGDGDATDATDGDATDSGDGSDADGTDS